MLGRSPGGGHGNPLLILPGESPRTEEPGGLPSTGSQSRPRLSRVGPREGGAEFQVGKRFSFQTLDCLTGRTRGGDVGAGASSPQAMAQGDPAARDGTGVTRCEENGNRAVSRCSGQAAAAGCRAHPVRACPPTSQPQGHRPKAASQPVSPRGSPLEPMRRAGLPKVREASLFPQRKTPFLHSTHTHKFYSQSQGCRKASPLPPIPAPAHRLQPFKTQQYEIQIYTRSSSPRIPGTLRLAGTSELERIL